MSSKPQHPRAWFIVDKSGDIWMESGSVEKSAAMEHALEFCGVKRLSDWSKVEAKGFAVRQFDLVPVRERR